MEGEPPVRGGSGEGPAAEGLVEAFRRRLLAALNDAGRNNPFLYFRETATTRFLTPRLGRPYVDALLTGKIVRRPDFELPTKSTNAIDVTPSPVPTRNRGVHATRSQPPIDPLMRRLRSIRDRAAELEEERGVQTLFAAFGMVSWPADDGGRAPRAPIVLLPIRVIRDPYVADDLAVRRGEDAEIIVNRSLTSVAAPEIVRLAAQRLAAEGVEDALAAISMMRSLVSEAPTVSVDDATALGIFNFAYFAMIEDLDHSQELMEQHPLVRALAGDSDAQAQLRTAVDEVDLQEVDELDQIEPSNEPFPLDADPWQAQAVHSIIQGEGHAVVDGPPGTGKSQTIANLIGALVERGQSVLFVAEKRAALDVVGRRLAEAGLGELVLDLHGNQVTRTKVFRQLRSAQKRLMDAQPVFSGADEELTRVRERLNEHRAFMHGDIPGACSSPYDLLGARA
ncbi:MAG: DUF4011 domain-containing protein, partial [Vulcanimicrobiaceae bacterium]